jgi:hypothetical protein
VYQQEKISGLKPGFWLEVVQSAVVLVLTQAPGLFHLSTEPDKKTYTSPFWAHVSCTFIAAELSGRKFGVASSGSESNEEEDMNHRASKGSMATATSNKALTKPAARSC